MFLDFFAKNPPIWKAWGLYKKDINELHLAEMKKLDEAKRKINEMKAKTNMTNQN